MGSYPELHIQDTESAINQINNYIRHTQNVNEHQISNTLK